MSALLLERTNGSCQPVGTKEAWNAKRERIRASWRLLLGEAPKQAPPLEPRTLWEEQKDGYRLRKVSYRVEADEVITSYLLLPGTLSGRAPAVIACMPTTVHGKSAMIGMAEHDGYWYPLELARRGYVVLAPEVFSTGERVPAGHSALDTRPFYSKHPGWSMLGKMLWDHQRGVDLLETLDFVDRERIGAVGWSLGAHNAAFLAAFDGRIAAAVSNGGIIHFAGAANPFAWCREALTPADGRVSNFSYMAPLRKYLLAGETPTDLHEMQALIAPRPYLDMNSVSDNWKSGLAASRKIRRLYSLLAAPDRFDYFVFDGAHSFPAPIRQRAFEWLDRYLGKGPAR